MISDANDENKNGNVPEKSESLSDKKTKKKSAKSTFLSSSNSNLLAPVASVPVITSTLNGTTLKSVPPQSKVEVASLPNFVKENFVGKSVMGTRCLVKIYSDLPLGPFK